MTDTRKWKASAGLVTALALVVAMHAPSAMATPIYTSDKLPGEAIKVTYGVSPLAPNGDTMYIGPGFVDNSAGQSSITLSSDTLAFLNAGKLGIQSPRTLQIGKDADGAFTNVSVTSPNNTTFNTIWIDDTSHAFYGMTMSSYFTITDPLGLKVVVYDLTARATDHFIYARVDGGGFSGQIPMFAYDDAEFTVTKGAVSPMPCYPSGVGGCDSLTQLQYAGLQKFDLNLSNAHLRLTPEGTELIAQALILSDPGNVALYGIENFGTLSMSATAYALPGYFSSAVPEPGTWALMGLGLIGLFGSSRRKVH